RTRPACEVVRGHAGSDPRPDLAGRESPGRTLVWGTRLRSRQPRAVALDAVAAAAAGGQKDRAVLHPAGLEPLHAERPPAVTVPGKDETASGRFRGIARACRRLREQASRRVSESRLGAFAFGRTMMQTDAASHSNERWIGNGNRLRRPAE